MAIQNFKRTSDILTAIQLFKDYKMTGSTWMEIFQVLSGSREQWVPTLDPNLMYKVDGISVVSAEFAEANASTELQQKLVAYL